MREGASIAAHTLRGGDSHGGGASVDLGEKE
jgi:type IV secretory pathway TrbL component